MKQKQPQKKSAASKLPNTGGATKGHVKGQKIVVKN